MKIRLPNAASRHLDWSCQELIELGGGRLRVKLRWNSLEEVERWVLGFGRHATVVGPEELKRRLFRTTEELWQRYGEPAVIAGQDEG
jgi:predicted DNA-binding transcriptional regulator YafY